MKKGFAVMLALMMLSALFLPLPASAESEALTSGDYTYILLEDGTAEIQKFAGTEEKVEVPAELDGKKVTSIGEDAFLGCKTMQEIMIPDGVTVIGRHAFEKCTALVKVTLPETLTTIKSEAFRDCDALVSITLPNSLCELDNNLFCYCDMLTDIVVSEDHPYLETDGSALYSKADKCLICYPKALTAESYTVKEGTEIIREMAFVDNKNIKEVILPDHMTDIGVAAFFGCFALESINLPEGLTVINDSTFYGCNLKKVVIPQGVTRIGWAAFAICEPMTEAEIPDTVEKINDNAFRSCFALEKVRIPASVTSFGQDIFRDCPMTLVAVVDPGSDAETYCRNNGIEVVYPETPAE